MSPASFVVTNDGLAVYADGKHVITIPPSQFTRLTKCFMEVLIWHAEFDRAGKGE